MPLLGRGTNYSRLRGASEWVLSRAYRGGWSAALVKGARLQPRVRVVAHHVDVGAPRWPAATRALRIAFASDLHAGPTTHPSLLDDAARALREAAPDVLLLGGDYVYLSAEHIDVLASRLREVPAPHGRFAVMGNHDLWARDDVIAAALERAGFVVLVNRAVSLPPPFAHVSICGLDDPWVGRPDARAAFEGAGDVRVLLMHAPEGLVVVGDTPFDVAVCGHTHGGHIALPNGRPIVTSGPLGRTYSHGRFAIDRNASPRARRTLIVSRGIGATESPLRLHAPPDVLAVTLGGSDKC